MDLVDLLPFKTVRGFCLNKKQNYYSCDLLVV